jgi:hypothetical protein
MIFISDCYAFTVFEILFLLFFVFAFFKDITVRHGGPSVTRGEESRKTLHLAYGFAAVLLMQVINSTEAYKGYKTIISVVNLAILLYLAYVNNWCRNKIVGIAILWQKKAERHH